MKTKILIIVYALVAFITYGHAYVHQTQYAVGYGGQRREAMTEEKGMVAFIASLIWPAYWSQHYFSEVVK